MKKVLPHILGILALLSSTSGFAQSEMVDSRALVNQAWEASAKGEMERLQKLVEEMLHLYGDEAKLQQKQLSGFPKRGEEETYKPLNDVGTILFIEAEALMNRTKTEEAIQKFQYLIATFPSAQTWDPRGWYWSVKEKSQSSIDVMTGKIEDKPHEPVKGFISKPVLVKPGTETIVDYTKYGEFTNVGTAKYRYKVKDVDGLKKAVGEGIYPNITDTLENPRYEQLEKEGRLKGSHWDFVNTEDLEAAYYKWFTASEPWGVRLFYLGIIFEKAEMYHEALKAYYALVVHYPKTVAWTYWQTPWYPGQAAIAKIRHILRVHPELNLADKYMRIQVQNGFDNSIENDIFVTFPGRILPKGMIDQVKQKLPWKEQVELKNITKQTGKGKVYLVQYDNGHWQLMVDGKPYVIRGLTYAPTKTGQSPDKGTLTNWMEADIDENGKIDGPYDSWVDKNGNNEQDADEPIVGDFQLLKDMGVNTIRVYHVPEVPNKELLRELYNKYGIRVIMGDFMGKYAIGSGASWAEGTDYENPTHRKNMLDSVKKMVNEYKDEPFILMWLLGNENNYGVASNADKKPEAWFQFANEVAKWIKSVDPDHPVAVNNGDTLFLDIFAANAPDIDVFSANIYRGDYGFGSFWEQVADASGKPAFITEYGAPAFAPHLTLEEGEKAQADYHSGNWLDIEENLAGSGRGSGNALGGVIFEWMDEWWKNYEPYLHDRKSDAIGPFPGGYYFEEWFGIVGQGNGKHSPFMRHLRKTYYMYKDLWN